MKKFIIFLIVIAAFAIACSTGKKASKQDDLTNAPEWVRHSPSAPGFYYGIGSASKALTDYKGKAKHNALSDLASSISVEISSSSVLNQYEFDNKYSEYFRDKIKLSSQNFLEGFELVGVWENENNYWVFYRLSKSEYERLKNERKNTALKNSLGNYDEASEFEKSGNIENAIRFYVKAIENIKDFLGEDLYTETDGRQSAYTPTLFSDLNNCVQKIKIKYPIEILKLKRGETPKDNELKIEISFKNTPLDGIPAFIKFSYRPGLKLEKVSDAKGIIRIRLNKTDTKNKKGYISSEINLGKIIKESTSDHFIRNLLSKINAPEFVLPVEIIPVVFYLESDEKNIGAELTKKIILPEFIKLLTDDGIKITKNIDEADFILKITSGSEKGKQNNKRFSANLSAGFKVTSRTGELVFSSNTDKVTGIGQNFKEAGLNAYSAALGKIRINIYPRMYDKIFTNKE